MTATHSPRNRIPSPSAPYRSLLWAIQQAHCRATSSGNSSRVLVTRNRVLAAAERNAARLAEISISQGIADYLMVADQPWDVLAARLADAGLLPDPT